MKRSVLFLGIILFLVFISSSVYAQIFSGRASMSAYTWEKFTDTDNSNNYLKLFQGVQLNVSGLAEGKVSLHSYLRFSENLGEKESGLKQGVYNLYMKIRKYGIMDEGVFGRQFIFTGVENGTIDGAKATFSTKKYGKVTGFAGILIPWSESTSARSWDDGNFIGLQYSNSFREKLQAKVTFFRKTRAQDKYTQKGRYTLQFMNISDLLSKGISLDAEYAFSPKGSFYFNIVDNISDVQTADIFTEFNLDRVELSAQYRPTAKLNLTAEYYYRRPQIYANSIFSIFTQQDNKEMWFRGSYRIMPKLYAYGNLAYVMFDNDESVRFNAGINSDFFSAGINVRNGYGGRLVGMNGTVQYPVMKNVLANASVNLSQYKLDDSVADLEDLVTSTVGVSYRSEKNFSVSLQGQGMRNAIYSNDFRVFLRGSYWFFSKKGKAK